MKNISPKVAPSVYSIMERMRSMGLSEDDLVTLIQRGIKPRNSISRTQVLVTLRALERIEKNFLRASKKTS